MSAERGFSILEVLVATTIMTVGLVSVAQLFAVAVRTNLGARTTTVATVLAEQKMEELVSGAPQGAVAGSVDYTDAGGNVLGGGDMAPSGTVYIRRWSVAPLPTDPANAFVLQVLVTRPGAAERARLVSVRMREGG